MGKGFFFRVLEDGTMVAAGRRPVPSERFAYDIYALTKFLETFPGEGWPDKALAGVLRWGADDYADGMPPVCVL